MLARIVRAGQSIPRRGLVCVWPGSQWKPLQNPGNHSGNQRLATMIFDNRLAVWFAPSSRKRVRTSVRTCYRYAPECVPTVRTELRTSCAQFAQLLRSPEAVAEA